MARSLFVAIVLGGVLLVAVSPALAGAGQPTQTPTDSNTTNGSSLPTPPGPNGSNQSAPEPPSGGFGIGGLFDPGQYGEDVTKGIMNWSVEAASGHLSSFVAQFNSRVYGLPAPGNPNEPMSWQNPQNGWWPAVWTTYLALLPVGLFFAFLGGLRIAEAPPERSRELLRQSVRALLAILFGFLVAPLGFHLGNAVSLGLAPSGAEFMSTPGSAAKLGLGVLIGFILIWVKIIVVIVGILVLLAQWFLAHIVVAFWPLFWGFRASSFDTLRAVGKAGIAAWVVLILLKVFQAGILRFLFEIPWDAGNPEALLPALVGTGIGVAVATIALPKVALSKMVPASMLILGQQRQALREHAPDGGRDVYESARESYRERYGPPSGAGGAPDAPDELSNGASDGYAGDSRLVGSVQTRSASYSRPGGKPGAQTRSFSREEQTRRTGYHTMGDSKRQ